MVTTGGPSFWRSVPARRDARPQPAKDSHVHGRLTCMPRRRRPWATREGPTSRTATKYSNTTTTIRHPSGLRAAPMCSVADMAVDAGSSRRRGLHLTVNSLLMWSGGIPRRKPTGPLTRYPLYVDYEHASHGFAGLGRDCSLGRRRRPTLGLPTQQRCRCPIRGPVSHPRQDARGWLVDRRLAGPGHPRPWQAAS